MREYMNVLKHDLHFSVIALIPIIVFCVIAFLLFNNNDNKNADSNNSENAIIENTNNSSINDNYKDN